IELLKSKDPHRQRVAELFTTWWAHNKSAPMAVNDLPEAVKDVVDPQKRGRQYLAQAIGRFVGTRAAGFVLIRQPSAGRWTAATYALLQESSKSGMGHRTHRTDQTSAAPSSPVPPMGPMQGASEAADIPPGSAAVI